MAFGPRPKPLADRFWPKVRMGAPDECWTWTATADHHGYGQIGYGGGNRHIKAHRASWLIHFGVLPPPEVKVCHRCDNPGCVNPGHLFLGTQADNHDDMKAKGRGNIGMRHGNHKLTDEQVIEIRSAAGKLDDIGARFGVSGSIVSEVQLGKSWKHVGGPIRRPRPSGLAARGWKDEQHAS